MKLDHPDLKVDGGEILEIDEEGVIEDTKK
jgi:hypothetical protein